MKIEQQVISLDQAKKLKELGVSRIGLGSEVGFYYWIGQTNTNELYYEESFPPTIQAVAAFTVAELGVMLQGHQYDAWGHSVFMCWYPHSMSSWHVGFRNARDEKYINVNSASFPTEVEARCHALIYLLENNLTTPQEVNQRLK